MSARRVKMTDSVVIPAIIVTLIVSMFGLFGYGFWVNKQPVHITQQGACTVIEQGGFYTTQCPRAVINTESYIDERE
jgi:hypothetical protein